MSDLTLDETSIQLHELYLSFQRAGFNKKESFELVKAMVRGTQERRDEN